MSAKRATARRTASKDISFDVIKDSYIGTLKKYVVFSGRARRREFWIFFFCNLVLGLIPFIGQIVALLTFIPNFAVLVRRLHDIDRSGKWLLLGLAPFVGMIFLWVTVFSTIVGGGRDIDVMGIGIVGAFSALVFLVSLGVLVLFWVWAAKEGTRGKNKYGPDPKARSR